jgi:hypothetical protein
MLHATRFQARLVTIITRDQLGITQDELGACLRETEGKGQAHLNQIMPLAIVRIYPSPLTHMFTWCLHTPHLSLLS